MSDESMISDEILFFAGCRKEIFSMMGRTALFAVLSFLIYSFNIEAEDVYSLWIRSSGGDC